ncbi:hypothetical protein [Burkholderia sp. PU8-34]
MIASNLVSSRCGSLRTQRRSSYRNVLRSLLLFAALAISVWSLGQTARAQELFIGDAIDNSVKHFDVSSGTFLGDFVPRSAGLLGPMGMIFAGNELVVVNQNAGTNVNGEIWRFEAKTGTFVAKLVAASNLNAPFVPQGMVRGGPLNHFYVADEGTQGNTCDNQGNVKEYDAAGAVSSNLDRHNFSAAFYPRGVVFGPDGLLYVSARGCPLSTDPSAPLIGYVLRFNPHTKAFVDVFVSNATVADLHRPEGLVFDKDGNLWVTSFRASSSDTDKILKLDGKTGNLLDKLELDTAGAPRSFAQAIIFGPNGKLFIPITGNDPNTTGEVRRCDTQTKECLVVVRAGILQQPWFLIFRDSDPATLSYHD